MAMRGQRLHIPVCMPHLCTKGGTDGVCRNEGRRLGGEGVWCRKRGVVCPFSHAPYPIHDRHVVYTLFLFICIVVFTL